MPKIKLGNDFDNGEDSEAPEVKESEEKTSDEEDEKENSASDDNGKNQDDESEKSDNDSEDSDDDDSEDDSKEDDSDDDDSDDDDESKKKSALDGLKKTEKELDDDNTSIDEAIEAARKRVSEKRKARREKRDLNKKVDLNSSKTDEETDDLSDIDGDTLAVLDRYTRAKGLVPKSEFTKMDYENKHSSAEEDFYEKHQEYKPENDEDDTLYNALKTELALFAAPKDPKMIAKLFERAHQSVVSQHPDKFRTKSNPGSDKQINKSVRLKSQGVGGKGGGGGDSKDKSNKDKKTLSEEQITALKDGGWSEEEIKDLIQ